MHCFFQKNKYSVHLMLVLGLLIITACTREDFSKDYHDHQLEISRDEFESKLRGREIQEKITPPPAIPKVSDILAAPPPPENIGIKKIVSLSVTEDVPLKDVLLELSRLADVEMEIDASIQGGIILRVKNRPFDEVISRVAELGDLRYSYSYDVLRVERDTPFVRNYVVDFLNLVRSNSGGLNVNTQVLGAGGTDGGSFSSGSTNAVTTSYEGDLWASIELAMTDILNFIPTSLASSNDDAEDTVANSNTNQTVGFSINKQAGVISVRASERQHRAVKQYLKEVREAVSAQVLIEAKIIEVNLDKEFRSGINWNNLLDSSTNLGVGGNFDASIDTGDFVTLSLFKSDNSSLNAAVQLTEVFGTTRTISSPRLHAMNNQQAILTFAENNVYFTIEVERQEEDDGAGGTDVTSTVESTLNTVPIGVILALQPSINSKTQEVTMNIRPTLSRITRFENDPGVELSAKQIDEDSTITSQIPIIEIRELDSILKVKSGGIMVIGGLMEERVVNTDIGVPFVSRVPFVGNAFKSVEKTTEVVETVIFIKATIVPPNAAVSKEDRDFYKSFTREPRPLTF